ncbi:MAG: helix-turn-helix transcriptional regulator, partial [Thermoanaerobaculia bacterium]
APEGLLGDGLRQLRGELLVAETSQDKFALADEWLLLRHDRDKRPPQELMAFIAGLQAAPQSRLNSLLESYSATQKNLIDQFKRYVGLTPKYYQRILRLNKILQNIHQQETISWAQVAYACGYSDQSHFIKDFKHFSGFNPSEFIGRDLDKEGSNFFPLDRDS